MRNPTKTEEEILRRNGIDMERTSYVVLYRHETAIYIKIHKTGDTVAVHMGDRKWEGCQ